jgi:hypothetical protein
MRCDAMRWGELLLVIQGDSALGKIQDDNAMVAFFLQKMKDERCMHFLLAPKVKDTLFLSSVFSNLAPWHHASSKLLPTYISHHAQRQHNNNAINSKQ